MTMATGRLHGHGDDRTEVNYSFLLGFVTPPVRIDPHTRDAEQSQQVNLRDVAEAVRQRSKAGIVDLTGDDRPIIFGALLWMAEKLRSDQHEQALWAAKGKQAFEADPATHKRTD